MAKYLGKDGLILLAELVKNWAAQKDHTHDMGDFSGTLPVSRGGTGATTAASALTNLGITATAAELNKLDGLATTKIELGYLDGVTSNVQTQLNGKLSTSGTAAAATKLATARNIRLSGDANGSVSFNGTANVNIPATVLHHGYTDITANSNLNSYTDPGWYRCAANVTAATISNSPTDNAFAMIVTTHAGTNQMVIEYMSSAFHIWTRNCYDNAWGSWAEVYTTIQKPTASEIGAAAASHNHSAANITSGTLAVARGGTGVTANPSMLINLGSTSAAGVFAASPRPGITGTLAVGHGGTGLTVSPSMLVNLGTTSAANVLQASPRPGITGTLPVSHGGTGAVAKGTTLLSNIGITISEDAAPATGTPGTIHIQLRDEDEDSESCKVLWSGAYYMTETHTAPLSETLTSQKNGIVLHWQAYSNAAVQNYDHFYQFVPKTHTLGAGVGTMMVSSGFGNIGNKYVYVHDDKIVGNGNNDASASIATGLSKNCKYWVLTEVLGI